MASRRQERVAELIHHEISNLLQFETQDPRIGFVTVTEVEVTPDLKTTTVYVSIFSGDEVDVRRGLKSAAPFFRRELGRRLSLRYTPAIEFRVDRSAAYGSKIDTLLSEIEIPTAEDPAPEPDSLSNERYDG